jgi:hypothetical protein
MHSRISHVVIVIAVGEGIVSALSRYVFVCSGNTKPFAAIEILGGIGGYTFCVH